MHEVRSGGRRGSCTIVWVADVPKLTVPKVKPNTITIDGTRYYVGAKGKLYECTAFDKMFKVEKGKMLPVNYKGRSVDSRQVEKDY